MKPRLRQLSTREYHRAPFSVPYSSYATSTISQTESNPALSDFSQTTASCIVSSATTKTTDYYKKLELWAADWGMQFNASKCYILSINSKTSFFYQLNNVILQHVDKNPYLGLLISKDLKWANHIEKTSKKASSTLGFIQRNLRHVPS